MVLIYNKQTKLEGFYLEFFVGEMGNGKFLKGIEIFALGVIIEL